MAAPAHLNTRKTWYAPGQFIPRVLWDEEKLIARAALTPLIDAFTDRLQYLRRVYEMSVQVQQMPDDLDKSKWVSLSETEDQMRAAIAETYRSAYTLGKRAAGNFLTPHEADLEEIQKTTQDEYEYLDNFLADMRTGGGTMDYHTRMDMYAKAARELFWLGFVFGNDAPGRRIEWVMGPTEHCTDCLYMNKFSPWSMDDFVVKAREGILPQSGRLECLGYRCACSLSDALDARKLQFKI